METSKMDKLSQQFRLPTKEEFDDLISNFSRWNTEKKGIEILNDERKILFLPATGFSSSGRAGTHGDYWSSTACKNDKGWTYECTFGLYFDSRTKSSNRYCNDCEYSVRLVNDFPFEGGIRFGNIYWKPENEEGYFTFDEAIKKFKIK